MNNRSGNDRSSALHSLKISESMDLIFLGILFVTTPLCAQIAVPPPAPTVTMRSSSELETLVGPIALYPDPLIAQVLPAATLPAQVVLAERFVNAGNDLNLIDQQPWDPS